MKEMEKKVMRDPIKVSRCSRQKIQNLKRESRKRYDDGDEVYTRQSVVQEFIGTHGIIICLDE